jgi:hypothetical protein
MKKFLIQTSIFTLIVALFYVILIGLFYLKSPENISNWFFGVNTNKKPKIILVGSSNIYCNYNYLKLNSYYNEYDVIGSEMAATVGFIPLISNLNLLDYSNRDIIIFCLPYQLYEPGYFVNFNDELAQKVLSRASIRNAIYFNPKQAFKNFLAVNFESYFRYLKGPMTIQNDTLVKFNTSQTVLLNTQDYLACEKIDDADFSIISDSFEKEYLSNFLGTINNDIEAQVFFRFPAVHKGETHVNPEKVNFLSTNFNFINGYNTTLYDSIYWFDNRYHLNKCGAEINTDALIFEIDAILKSND